MPWTVAEFEALLASEYGMAKTEYRTETGTFWRTHGGRQTIMVPILKDGESYHDWHLGFIVSGLNRMNQNPKNPK